MYGMSGRLITTFFIAAIVFLFAHITAMYASLYWYFWWADIIMHFWGGLLLGMGVHVLASLPHIPVRASVPWLLAIILVVTLSWEIFERSFGLFNPVGYMIDTSIDIALGFLGGLVAHVLLRHR